MVRRSKVHFVHCLLPKAEAVGGGDLRVTHGESPDSGLMTLDVGLLRAQLRGSKLLDALRIYRQGNGRTRLRLFMAIKWLDEGACVNEFSSYLICGTEQGSNTLLNFIPFTSFTILYNIISCPFDTVAINDNSV